MERLIKQHGDQAVRMLTTQYRMNELIMTWPSQQLYEGRLLAHQSVATHLLKDLPNVVENENTSTPLLLVDTTGCNLHELDMPDEVSKGNEGEADVVAYHVEQLVESGLTADNIAVIAPYNLQVELLRVRLSHKYPQLEIKSVDGFQGREKEAVVISMVRSNDKGVVGFLAEDRRINVAITRARRHLAVICDAETVSHHDFLKSLVDYMTEHGDVRSAQEYIDAGALQLDTKRPEHMQFQMADAKPKQKGQTKPKSGKKTKPQKEENQKKGEDVRPKFDENKAKWEEDQRREEEIREIMISFAIDDLRQEHPFPSTFTSKERYMVHEIAERLNLLHISEGQDDERHITVKKPPPAQNNTSAKLTSQHPNAKSDKDDSTPINEERKDKQIAVKADSDSSQPSKPEETSKDNHESDAGSDIAKCPICDKPIPTTNIELHRLRCVPPPSLPPSAGAKPKKKKKSARGNKQKDKKDEEEDFDALIAAAIKENTVCHFPKCKAYTTCLGQDCGFCGRRFCIKHHIPEVHGCGDKAKVNARMVISREGVLHQGSGVPDKSIDPARRAFLERRMDKKLGEMGEKRKVKKKDNNTE